MSEARRYCPLCERMLSDAICPEDGVQTVPCAAIAGRSQGLHPGTTVGGRYRIVSPVGSGAMGTVYVATQLGVQRTVALKVLRADAAHDALELRRFYREARSLSQLAHPHVVKVFDFGFDDDSQQPYLAMELLHGRPLRSIIEEEAPLALTRASELTLQIARGLSAAHEAGIVHRDLKPDNIVVRVLPDGEEHATVLDFGIAKPVPVPPQSQPELTASGVIVGTPRYMSPEQVRGGRVGPAGDLYALGCILHELISGNPPFQEEDVTELMLVHLRAPPPSIPHLSPGPLADLRVALLAKDPLDRPSSAATVVRWLRAAALSDPLPINALRAGALESTVSEETDAASSATLTTLAGDTSDPTLRPVRGRARRWGLIAASVLAIAIVGALAWDTGVSSSGWEPSDPTAGHAVSPLREAPAPSGNHALRSKSAKTRIVEVLSTPSGAEVYANGLRLGATPLLVEVPQQGLQVRLLSAGYVSTEIELSFEDQGPVAVVLERGRSGTDRSERGASGPSEARSAVVLERKPRPPKPAPELAPR